MSDDRPISALWAMSDRLDALTESARQLTDVAAKVGELENRNRRLLAYMLAAGLAVLLLALVTAGVALQARGAAHDANTASSGVVQACRSRNETKRLEVQLWGTVLRLSAQSPPTDRTPEERARSERLTAQFRQYLAEAFALEDCVALAEGRK